MFSNLSLCKKLMSKPCPFFPQDVKTAFDQNCMKIHKELRKKTRKRRWTYKRSKEEGRGRFFFYSVKFLRNIIGKRACMHYLFIYF